MPKKKSSRIPAIETAVCPCTTVATTVPAMRPPKVPADRCSARMAVSARELVLLNTMNAVMTAQYQRTGESRMPQPSAMAQASVTWIGRCRKPGLPSPMAAGGGAGGAGGGRAAPVREKAAHGRCCEHGGEPRSRARWTRIRRRDAGRRRSSVSRSASSTELIQPPDVARGRRQHAAGTAAAAARRGAPAPVARRRAAGRTAPPRAPTPGLPPPACRPRPAE